MWQYKRGNGIIRSDMTMIIGIFVVVLLVMITLPVLTNLVNDTGASDTTTILANNNAQTTTLQTNIETANTTAYHAELEIEIVDSHLHNTIDWYGKRSPQTATQWAQANSFTSFNVTSGNGDWTSNATAEQVFGTGDVLRSGQISGDFNEILFDTNSSATVYFFRLLWCTGAQTVAEAIDAFQYTETMFLRPNADNNRKVMTLVSPRLPIDCKIYALCKNQSNGASLTFYIGVHGYPLVAGNIVP